MTLTIKGIDREEPDKLDRNPDALHQFWTAAGDVFIKIAPDQPDIQQLSTPSSMQAVTLKSPRTIARGGFR